MVAGQGRRLQLSAARPRRVRTRLAWEQGNVVMLDPAGHPFCIGTRV
jgi:hypothetical protein